MRRCLVLSPIVLVAAGCDPWVPPESPAGVSLPAEPHVEVTRVAGRSATRAWQLPQGDPWTPYAKYTLLASLDAAPGRVALPDVSSLDSVRRAAEAARRIAGDGLPPDTLWVVDLRGPAAVAFGTSLSHVAREPVSLVPTFNNWPAEDEMVPAEETLAALTTMSPAPAGAAQSGSARPVFLLDAWRLAYRDDEPGDDTYDNRYALTPSDLPDAATLYAQGIRRVVYLVQSRTDMAAEEDDLHATFLAWQAAGIRIAMVDLDRFEQPILVWDDLWIDDDFVVQPRLTILDDPGFFERAHGGFGGVHARPSHVHSGGVWSGHGGLGGAGGHAHGASG